MGDIFKERLVLLSKSLKEVFKQLLVNLFVFSADFGLKIPTVDFDRAEEDRFVLDLKYHAVRVDLIEKLAQLVAAIAQDLLKTFTRRIDLPHSHGLLPRFKVLVSLLEHFFNALVYLLQC